MMASEVKMKVINWLAIYKRERVATRCLGVNIDMCFFKSVGLYAVLAQHWSLFCQLTKREMQQRYQGSMLGMLWCLALPLLRFCVYIFVFGYIFQSRWADVDISVRGSFAIIMFCGLSVFTMFSESVAGSCKVIVGHRNLVKNVVFPIELLPFTFVCSTFLFGFIWLVLLLVGTFWVFGTLHLTTLFIPIIVFPLFLISLGLSYFVSSLVVYIRDFQHFVPVVMQILFFMTPIFYSIDRIPFRYRWIMQLNPICLIVEEMRRITIFGMLPDWMSLLKVYLLGVCVCYLGYAWFAKTKKGFVDVI